MTHSNKRQTGQRKLYRSWQAITSALFAIGLILSSQAAQAELKIIATTGMIADLTKQIGAQHVKVTALMGPSVDPHLYKATQGDIRRLTRADIVLYNGLHLEGKMQDIFEKMARKKAVFAISSQIPNSQQLKHGSVADPHIWFDINLWQQAAQRVLEILVEQDPQHRKDYQQNANNYLSQLTELHQWVHEQITEIPQSQRILITAHDAFGYFGKAYGLTVMGLQGMSTASEFGLQDIKLLKDVIVKHQIKAVFIESSVSPRFIQALVEGVKAEGHQLKIGGELFSDALGTRNSPQGTYIGMVKHNVTTIVDALK